MRSFRDFCETLTREIDFEEQLDPEYVGQRFREYFELPHRPDREELVKLLENGGIGTVRVGRLPRGLRGIHFSAPDGGYDVRYSEGQWKERRNTPSCTRRTKSSTRC